MRNMRGIATALPLTALALCLTLIAGCATSPTPGQSHQAGSTPHHAPTAHHATGHPAAATPAATAPDVRDAATLKPGEFTWHPERAPSGPVVIIVSIPEQRAYVYRNGIRIGASTVSTGKPGHDTPTGVFSILEKDQQHVSSTYQGAAMPYMERLTWDGIALHAGRLPGYPASHGCVRLPLEFSRKLYSVTHSGTHVVIADAHSAPADIVHPGLAAPVDPNASGKALAPTALAGQFLWEPHKAPQGPVSVVISGPDRRMYVFRNGVLIGEAAIQIRDPHQPLGAGVFVALDGFTHAPSPFAPDRPQRRWMAVGLPSHGGQLPARLDLGERVHPPAQFSRLVYELLQPGASLVVTDRPARPESRTQPGFRIMADS
ncbi:MAG: L,D-transpeptidase [Candidatus Contendobacter sp.]|nr:MAG: L,D-transpeptidase [Candidatus Contendobacter sp.]